MVMVRLEKVPGPFFGRGLGASPTTAQDPTLVVLTSELRVVVPSGKVELLQRAVLEASDIT